MKEKNIDTIIHLGDIFDKRKNINFNTLKECKRYFFDEAKNQKIALLMITGNHDTYYKNTNELNSPEILLSEYENVKIFSEPKELKNGILLMPWICSGNYEESMKILEETDASACFGHFELAGFKMYKNNVNMHGMGTEAFSKFDLVLSGHFHHRHKKGNIMYLGSPYEMTWSDYNDERGFHIYDTETKELEFIQNPYSIFHKIEYDEDGDLEIDKEKFSNGFVRLLVQKKDDLKTYDKFIKQIQEASPEDLKIIEELEYYTEGKDEEIDIEFEDTLDSFNNYIDDIETDLDKERLKFMVKNLYEEVRTC